MPILEKRTHLSPYVIRRAAYDRLVPGGSDSGFLHWMQIKKREFERLHPGRTKRSDENRMAFDRWLEGLK
ncbi:MAG: hypothetical protein RBT67_02955 [Thauera sp.]|nr:hypothetical protein [Thauera sp.]